MGFWNWIKLKSKAKHSRGQHTKPLDPKVRQAFGRVKRDIKTLKTGIAEINTQLTRHSETLQENTRLINNHTSRLDKLEELVIAAPPVLPPVQQQQDAPTNRPIEPTNRLVATKIADKEPFEKLDIQSLSPQEKNILQVFMTHRDMALSYGDIAKSLNKSPNTIKNQIRQLGMKANLLEKTVDDKNKNRFKLKKHIKIEADLDSD